MLCSLALTKVIVSPSGSEAVIVPAVAPSELFSLTPDRFWLLTVGWTLSVTLIVTGKVVTALASSPATACSSEAVILKLYWVMFS